MTVPYTAQTDHYNFAFYFGPNKYAILKHVATTEGDDELHLERLIPLGWGIFGWVNRWFVIPVFDFLRQFIPEFRPDYPDPGRAGEGHHLAADL